jgi:Protein of unknown function (DUF3313)
VAHKLFTCTLASLMLVAGTAGLAKPPATWDGLVQVKSKRLNLVYLQPGADFRPYTKVMLDPTEVAFQKNWRRDYNSTAPGRRISDQELQSAISKGVSAASDIFAEAWTKGGYQVVTAPGPDVLRVTTGVVNIDVNAPDRPSAGRSYSFSSEAGSATLFVEARDSMTGAILGRAVDPRIVGDNSIAWRTSVSNRADFRDMVKTWADASVRGLGELKSLSPVQP